eukprot:359432-Chlamydomonas_euryale.AAC.5
MAHGTGWEAHVPAVPHMSQVGLAELLAGTSGLACALFLHLFRWQPPRRQAPGWQAPRWQAPRWQAPRRQAPRWQAPRWLPRREGCSGVMTQGGVFAGRRSTRLCLGTEQGAGSEQQGTGLELNP